MRRPLDWIVVSIALLVLLVNQQWRVGAGTTAGMPADESPRRAALQMREANSPFGYILEDGSEIYLPVKQTSPHSAGDAPASSATAAVFTWSAQATTPMLQ